MSWYLKLILAFLAILVSCLATPGTEESSNQLKHVRVERNVPPRFLMAAVTTTTTHRPTTRPTYPTPVTVKDVPKQQAVSKSKNAGKAKRSIPPKVLKGTNGR